MAFTLKGRKIGASYGNSEGVIEYICISDSTSDEGEAAIATVGVPDYGDTHPTNSTWYALDFDAQQDDRAWWKWTVTVTYRRPEVSQGESEDGNPLNQDPDIWYDVEEYTVAAVSEINATTGVREGALAGSAGEPYDPPPDAEEDILVINITRNETPAFSLNTYWAYNNAVNSNSFTFGDLTVPVGWAKIRIAIGKTESFVNPSDSTETLYRQVTYQLRIKRNGWDLEVLDRGSYYLGLVGGTLAKIPFLTGEPGDDDRGQYIGLLNGSGGALPDGGTPVYNSHTIKKQANFATLSLPAGP